MSPYDQQSSPNSNSANSSSPVDVGDGIRWIVFDAVGTLMTPFPSVAQIYRQIAVQYGSSRSELEIEQRFHAAYHKAESSSDGLYRSSEEIERCKWREIVATVLDDVSDAEGCFEALFSEFAKPSVWRVYDDVEPTLRKLSKTGYCLAVASNFDGRLHNIFDAKREFSLIQYRAVSSEIGYRKPSPQFYDALLDQLDSAPTGVLMVGDDLENDVTVPGKVGLHAVHLQRENEPVSGAISTLSELISFCETSDRRMGNV